MKRFRRGQGTLEYVIILAAIVAAIIVVANSYLKPRLQSSYGTLTGKMQTAVGKVEFK